MLVTCYWIGGLFYYKLLFLSLAWPKPAKVLAYKTKRIKKTTRKDNEMLVEHVEKNTFSNQDFTTFNDLPTAIWIIDNKKACYRESEIYYIDKAIARILFL